MPKEAKKSSYKVVAALIADDYRREDNGKDILIGIYKGSAIFPGWPAALPKLVFYVVVDIEKGPSRPLHMKLVDDKGKERAELKAQSPERFEDGQLAVNFQIQHVLFTEEVRLDFLFGVDEEPRVLASLEVRLARTEEEKRRLSK